MHINWRALLYNGSPTLEHFGMKSFVLLALLVVVGYATAQETAPTEADPNMLKQALDGAMTCSALTAIKASQLPVSEAWQWENRSFAFGMLAARFWYSLFDNPMTSEQLDEMLNKYADRIDELSPDTIAPFEIGCRAKYEDIDALCEQNTCPNAGPPREDDAQ